MCAFGRGEARGATTTRKTTRSREVEDDDDERGLLSPPSFSPHKGSRQDTQGLGTAAAAGEPTRAK